jgi:hypothetical protein
MKAIANAGSWGVLKQEGHSAEAATSIAKALPPLLLQLGRRVTPRWKPVMQVNPLSPRERAWIQLMGNPYAVLALTDESGEGDSFVP